MLETPVAAADTAAFAAAAATGDSVPAAVCGADVAITFADPEFDAEVVTTPEALFWPAGVAAGGKVEVVKTSAVLWPGGNVICWANSVNAADWVFPFDGAPCR